MKNEIVKMFLSTSKKMDWKELTQEYYKKKIKKFDNQIRISLCQNKGGVGKTTSTIQLGYLFSCIGKTLLIDMDSQANLSQTFNVFEAEYFLKVILV